MSVLEHLEPKKVFHYFEEISAIPHGSGNTKQISDYLVDFAGKRNLEVIQDESNNIIIIKEAVKGYENAPAVMIQGHMDMVCEKTADCSIDFEKDGLELGIEGDYLFAKGTTLGGDDGIAVAYALAILDSDTIKHPRLEIVITVDEEIGLLGATALDMSMLKAKYLLNIDSEEEGILTTSCAGGLTGIGKIPVHYTQVTSLSYSISVEGLLGGHSGTEIDKEHANSNILMGRLLYVLSNSFGFGLSKLEGGLKDNAIPRITTAEIFLDEKNEQLFLDTIKQLQADFTNEYKSSDPDIKIKFTSHGSKTGMMLTPNSKEIVTFLLMNMPNGIQRMSSDIKGLVKTSLNLGILELGEEELTYRFSIRSSVASERDFLSERISYLTEFLGGEYYEEGKYPGWEFNPDSKLRKLMTEAYEEQYGQAPKVEAIHAGLECGILSSKMENLDCISFGPDMQDIHTTSERLSISSAGRVWNYLLHVLEKIKE